MVIAGNKWAEKKWMNSEEEEEEDRGRKCCYYITESGFLSGRNREVKLLINTHPKLWEDSLSRLIFTDANKLWKSFSAIFTTTIFNCESL